MFYNLELVKSKKKYKSKIMELLSNNNGNILQNITTTNSQEIDISSLTAPPSFLSNNSTKELPKL